MVAGREYETHLQRVVRLGLLWNYRGFYIDPTLQAADALKFISELNHANALVSKESMSQKSMSSSFVLPSKSSSFHCKQLML